jgi:hypothetical protein
MGPRGSLELVDVTAFHSDESAHLRVVDLDVLDDGSAQLFQVLIAQQQDSKENKGFMYNCKKKWSTRIF